MARSARPSAQHHATSDLSWTETTVSAPGKSAGRLKSVGRWDGKPRITSKDPNGPASLREHCIRVLLGNIDYINVDTLLGLPYSPLGAELWRRVEFANLTTPTVWGAFCNAFPEEEAFHYYTVSDMTPKRTMDEYVQLLSSPRRSIDGDFAWLTALTMSNMAPSHSELMALTRIPNLVALDLHHPDNSTIRDNVDYRLIRSYADHAASAGAFSRLQVMIVRNHHGVTAEVLEQLSSFPSLTLFGARSCALNWRHEEEARTYGWTTTDEHNILADVHRDVTLSQNWHGLLYGCIRRSRSLLEAHRKQAPPATNFDTTSSSHTSNSDPVISPTHTMPPLLNYRLGVSDSATYYGGGNDTAAPLIFFRSLSYDASKATQPARTYASRKIWPREGMDSTSGSSTAKKRKLRGFERKTVADALAEYGVDVGPAAGSGAKEVKEEEVRRQKYGI